ncbi:hypothetical protein [Acetobacter sp.]|uniref:hypothetical protein n=1 Tax=Acetobacter sp. TaxID=440 RepID=UPI002587FC81|nr:hypothetical protein [Acetobacter sp.]MCC6104783.1 hypothetical protein [Acetobacter sp.]
MTSHDPTRTPAAPVCQPDVVRLYKEEELRKWALTVLLKLDLSQEDMNQIYDIADGMVRYVMLGRSGGDQSAAGKPGTKLVLPLFRRAWVSIQRRFETFYAFPDKLHRRLPCPIRAVLKVFVVNAPYGVPDNGGCQIKRPPIIVRKRLLHLLQQGGGFLEVEPKLGFARRFVLTVCRKVRKLPEKLVRRKSGNAHKESSFHVGCNSMMDVAGGGGNATARASHFPKTDGEAA